MNKLLAALSFGVFLAATDAAPAQNSAPQALAGSAISGFSSEQLEQLVAPVALYPDPLLADVLTASTYPLEVVDADRWIADPQNSELTGDDLTDALNARGWDPSVQSLAPFPQVLRLMDNHLEWMETLGEAFLAQPGDVMDAVQRIRARAQGAGNLPSNGEETVTDQNGDVAIAPPADLIYVPQYDPWCAFGDWPYPVASPSYFGSWSGNCDPADYGVAYAPGIAWPFSYWGWGYFDWRNHHVLIHPDKYNRFHPDRPSETTVWAHDPQRRDGAFYRNARNIGAFRQAIPRGAPLQIGINPPARAVRSGFPVRNWNSGRMFRVPPRPIGSGSRPGFGRAAPALGRAHASRGPDHH